MLSFNLCTFVGNVGPAPELKKTSDGTPYARFRLAVETDFRKEATSGPMWLTVVAWRSLAEQVVKVVKKGSLVLVSGKLSIRSYTDKEQASHIAVEILAHTVQVFPGGAKTQEQNAEEADAEAIATEADKALSGTQENLNV